MEVAKETLNSFPKKLFTTKIVIRILFEILTLNNFIFNGIHYVQKLGCVMGTICTPNYSNIFRGNFERNFMHPHFQTFLTFYCRFINHISPIEWKKNTIIRFYSKIKF